MMTAGWLVASMFAITLFLFLVVDLLFEILLGTWRLIRSVWR